MQGIVTPCNPAGVQVSPPLKLLKIPLPGLGGVVVEASPVLINRVSEVLITKSETILS